MKSYRFICAHVTQVLCKGISITSKWTLQAILPLSFVWLSDKLLFFPFESFMTHFYSFAVKNTANISLHYVSEHSTWLL